MHSNAARCSSASTSLGLRYQNFGSSRNANRFAIVVCFMPDHVHLLLEASMSAANLRRCVKRMKQHSGAAYKLRFGSPLWQEGYFDRVLREDENTVEVVRYILNNPVRAGLVMAPQDYPFLGSDKHARRTVRIRSLSSCRVQKDPAYVPEEPGRPTGSSSGTGSSVPAAISPERQHRDR